MLNLKQFGCLKFLSVKHNWKFKKQKFFCSQSKNFPPDIINDIRDTGPDTENTDHGLVSYAACSNHGPDMGFYGPPVNQSE
jgi:hypothetical protein